MIDSHVDHPQMKVPVLNLLAYHRQMQNNAIEYLRAFYQSMDGCSAPQGGTTQIVHPSHQDYALIILAKFGGIRTSLKMAVPDALFLAVLWSLQCKC